MPPENEMPVPVPRAAGVYRVHRRLIVCSDWQTVTGLWLQREPVALPDGAGPAQLGEAVLAALANSRTDVPHPGRSDWKSQFGPFLEAARVKSYQAFMADARYVALREESGVVTLEPQRNEGASGGFEAIEEQSETLATRDPGPIGEAVLRLLNA